MNPKFNYQHSGVHHSLQKKRLRLGLDSATVAGEDNTRTSRGRSLAEDLRGCSSSCSQRHGKDCASDERRDDGALRGDSRHELTLSCIYGYWRHSQSERVFQSTQSLCFLSTQDEEPTRNTYSYCELAPHLVVACSYLLVKVHSRSFLNDRTLYINTLH